MNSLVQEASTVVKAVEQAWNKAGKPQKFSIRVFQEEQKNFFGMTKQNAKIALFFDPRDVIKKEVDDKPKQAQQQKKHEKKPSVQKQKEVKTKKQDRQPVKQQKPASEKKSISSNQNKQKEPKQIWSDEMVAIARNWMREALQKMGKSDVSFTTEVKRYHLKFYFDKVLAKTEEQQKNMFRSFAHLIMQTIRNRLKKQLRYHKVVLSSGKKESKQSSDSNA